MTSDAERRIMAGLPEAARNALLHDLSPADLATLQLAVAKRRAANVDPARLMRRWREDRFVAPSATDPRRLAEVEATLWRLLPGEFEGVELSPVAPLGTCAAVGAADQNRIVSTVRQTEVVSDPTNVLAIDAATRRRAGARVVHLAACQRVVRAQQFSGPGQSAHFKLFALVSSQADIGSHQTEADLLVTHLRYWFDALHHLLPGQGRIALSQFDDGPFGQRLADTVRPALAGHLLLDAPNRAHGRNYYTVAALQILVEGSDGPPNELGDGGFTRWTAQLSANAKERCLVSCIATERLTEAIQTTKTNTYFG